MKKKSFSILFCFIFLFASQVAKAKEARPFIPLEKELAEQVNWVKAAYLNKVDINLDEVQVFERVEGNFSGTQNEEILVEYVWHTKSNRYVVNIFALYDKKTKKLLDELIYAEYSVVHNFLPTAEGNTVIFTELPYWSSNFYFYSEMHEIKDGKFVKIDPLKLSDGTVFAGMHLLIKKDGNRLQLIRDPFISENPDDFILLETQVWNSEKKKFVKADEK